LRRCMKETYTRIAALQLMFRQEAGAHTRPLLSST
jgi:hypothetical protein